MSAGVAILLLAAGRSSRTGASHKLLATFGGVPLIRRSAETALAASAHAVVAVLGHRAPDMEAALSGLPLAKVVNPHHGDGLSTSLLAGLDALPAGWRGVLVMLADQPHLTAAHLTRLMNAFEPAGRGSIVVATDGGRRFNPVVLSRLYEPELRRLAGDVGARSIVGAHAEAVREVEIGPAASIDVDTPEALAAAGGEPEDRASFRHRSEQ